MESPSNCKSHRRLTSSTSTGILDDRISDLPDSIIEHILSFLDAKDAFKTCVLSKRWEHLWTYIPNLLFYCKSCEPEEYHRYASFVGNTLMKHTSSKIKKFVLQYHSLYTSNDQLDSWLQFALNREVEELCLHCFPKNQEAQYECPEFMYMISSSVTKMSLSFRFEEELEGFYWRSLKILRLECSILRNETVRTILLGCPSLECLTLRGCKLYHDHDGFSIIDASDSSLKELVIDGHYTDYDSQRIYIIAPNLLSLTTLGLMEGIEFMLVNVSSLMEANLNFKMGWGVIPYGHERLELKHLLKDLRHVNKLAIGIWCSQFRFIRKAIRARLPTRKRKILEIDMESMKGCLAGLSALLYSLPNLERLNINLMPPGFNEFKREDWYVDMPSRPTIKPTSMRHLKRITISRFVVRSCSSSNMVLINTVQYLLANAKVLKKLIIRVRIDREADAQPEILRKWREIAKEVLRYPRASPDARVRFITT